MTPYLDPREARYPERDAWIHRCGTMRDAVVLLGGWCKWCDERRESNRERKESPRSS